MPESDASKSYTEADIRSLDWREHIRLRPGMYIGKLGDGSQPDDGIYVLLKEALDNSIDEFVMGHGKRIDIEVEADRATVRDYGRGIPLGKLMDCAARINTGAKYDSEAFKRSVGLNGVGIKAVNALSSMFEIQAFRDGKTKAIEFSEGLVTTEMKRAHTTDEPNGTKLVFVPDDGKFGDQIRFRSEIVENMCRFYSWLNPGLALVLNGKRIVSKNGLLDLLQAKLDQESLYPVVHFEADDIEVAFTHTDDSGEEHYSFVNGQHTTQGGSHLAAFREAVVKGVREFSKKSFEPADVRNGLVAAVSVRVQEPVFESQTKTKLGSTHMEPEGRLLRTHVNNVVAERIENHLHQHPDTAKALLARIQRSERERKELAGIRKAARESNRKARVHNKKLRDCRVRFNSKHKDRDATTIFITEGDSATGSITIARDVETQAVFSLRGKPLNCFGLSRKVVYQNEEFHLLQSALDIEDGVDGLRYNRVVLATDADVDGMHIRLLLLTFFLQFFPELVRNGHLFILQTPLFRVRDRKQTRYCYSEEEKREAVEAIGRKAEITRFKGLGEISPSEMKDLIGEHMRLDPVQLDSHGHLKDLLSFYMGKNTPDRQEYIIDNLRFEVALNDTGDEDQGLQQEELASAG